MEDLHAGIDYISSQEESLAIERMRKKLKEVNAESQSYFAAVHDHIDFTLQKAFFECAYQCFDRNYKMKDDISACVQQCEDPVLEAEDTAKNEVATFQRKLIGSVKACQDRYRSEKIHSYNINALQEYESCVESTVEENNKIMAHVVAKLKSDLSIQD